MVGLLAINKSPGPSSHDVVEEVRRRTGGLKAGHAGTLDPHASGVLLVLLDQATKLAPLFVGLPKKYRASFRLGLSTDTNDIWGSVLAETPVPELAEEQIEEVLSSFVGTIKQKVPIFSAVKSKGQPLYKKARRGEEVETPEKEVTFYSIQLLVWKSPEIELEVACSSGAYIRALARDFGERIGCGAVMSSLVRIEVGPVTLAQSVSLDGLDPQNWGEHLLFPQDVLGLPVLRLMTEPARVRDGKPLFLSDLDGLDDFEKGQAVFVENGSERILAWGHLAESADFLKKNPSQPAFVYGRVLV
ncbi:MAG: tRNA pseudouridine(55) synthase TruB [candidate division Zixibacteria bacterium]|nr:tRNA pseudouridine(55) synthase TruB [candidate division Zixibacteria bacterium]